MLVNPYDIEATADALHQAYFMDHEERRRRMRLLRSEVKRNDVHQWLQSFTRSLQES